jgi:hypothetical protein
MQIDSLTKLGKDSGAEELPCIRDMFSVEQSVVEACSNKVHATTLHTLFISSITSTN